MQFEVIWLGPHNYPGPQGTIEPGEVFTASDSWLLPRLKLIAVNRIQTRDELEERLSKMAWDELLAFAKRFGVPGNSKAAIYQGFRSRFTAPTSTPQEEE